MIFTPLTSGTSVEGVEIPAFKTDLNADKYLYLMAGTHGDEVEGVYVLQQLFEWLKGDLKGYASIRINDQWRIVFKINKSNELEEVEIVDYHK